jgi:hypothetical protein
MIERNTIRIIISCALLVLFFNISCDNSIESEEENENISLKNSNDVTFIPKPDTMLSRIALVLGGLNLEGILNDWEINQMQSWSSHSRLSDKMWYKTDEKIPYMEKWADLYIKPNNKGKGVLFYPFAGPDFLFADVFFPQTDTVIMIGLEPVGFIPNDLQELKKDNTEFLTMLRSSLNSIMHNSFFLTNSMAVDFTHKIDGVLSAILHFAVRRSYLIHDIRRVYLKEDGTLNDMDNGGLKGNAIYLLKDGKIKVVYYFSVNLMNDAMNYSGAQMAGLSANTPFLQFLKRANINATYLKAASYLLHNPQFSTIRNLLTEESNLILQDDSGIPLKFIKPDDWKVRAFGVYDGPISLFSSKYQSDMKRLYVSSDPLGLPFGVGYKWRLGTSNLQLMIKYNEKGVKENQVSEVVSFEKEVTSVSPKPEPISVSSVPKQQISISNTSSGAYLIGCYAVSEKEKAKQLANVLRSKNFEAGYFYIPDYEPSGSRTYRVYIGPFLNRDLALQELSNAQQYIKEAYIVNMKQLPSLQQSGETVDTVHIRNE